MRKMKYKRKKASKVKGIPNRSGYLSCIDFSNWDIKSPAEKEEVLREVFYVGSLVTLASNLRDKLEIVFNRNGEVDL